jgi:hypothetical protein
MKRLTRKSFYFALILLAAWFLAGGMRLAYAQIPVLTPAQYDTALAAVAQAEQSQVELENGGSGTHVVDPQDALRPILHCQVRDQAGGWIVTANNLPLRDSISSVEELSDPDERQAGRREIIAQIQLIRSDLNRTLLAPGSQDATRSVRQVLSTNEFSSLPIPPPSRFDRMVDAFGRWLNRELSKVHGPSGPAPHVDPRFALDILIAILGAAAIFLIALLVVAITRYLANRRAATVFEKPVSSLAMTGEEASLVAMRDFERLLALAHRHREDGDHRSAFRLAYLATLVFLDSEGVVRLNRSKTNWEYLHMVRHAGEEGVYTALAPFTRKFDRIWYGLRPADSSEFEEAIGHHSDVRNALRNAPEPGATQPARA